MLDAQTDADIGEFLCRLRNRQPIDVALQERIARVESIDGVREKVGPEDVDLILAIASSSEGEEGMLGFALLKPFVAEPKVSQFLQDQWETAQSYLRRKNLVWPLLDIPNLPDATHWAVFSFVEDNLDRFVDDCVPWYGGPSGVLDGVRARLDRLKTPQKAWIYLCAALGSDAREGISALLIDYSQNPVGINALVAGRLLERVQRA